MKPLTGGGEETSPIEEEALSAIIRELNERFGTEFGEEHKVVIEQLELGLFQSPALEASVRANTPDNARLTFDHVVGDLLQDLVETNFELYKKVTDDEKFGEHFKNVLYERYRKNVESTAPEPPIPPAVDVAVERLVAEMKPAKIILFGTAATGEMTKGSDIDLMVILDETAGDGSEQVKAYEVVGSLGVAKDLLVFSKGDVEKWGNVVGHIIHTALRDGRVIYDAD